MSDIIHIAYFFLLSPVEYIGTKSPTTPFQLKDVSLSCGTANFDIFQTPTVALKTSTYGKMDFTMKKNDVHGEGVVHGTSGDALMCPNSALVFCVL